MKAYNEFDLSYRTHPQKGELRMEFKFFFCLNGAQDPGLSSAIPCLGDVLAVAGFNKEIQRGSEVQIKYPKLKSNNLLEPDGLLNKNQLIPLVRSGVQGTQHNILIQLSSSITVKAG